MTFPNRQDREQHQHQLRSLGAAADPDLGPDQFWLQQQPGANRTPVKATNLPPTAHLAFVTLAANPVCPAKVDPADGSLHGCDKCNTESVRKFKMVPPPPPTTTTTTATTAAAATDVGATMKNVIQGMFDVTQTVVGFVPESQDLLVDRVEQLTRNLAHLSALTDPQESPDNPVHGVKIAPEIVDYVDDGRNPDIFSRDFVERVQRGNAVMGGKKEAFRTFAQILAREMKKGMPGIDKEVDEVMEKAGIEQLGPDDATAAAPNKDKDDGDANASANANGQHGRAE